MYILWKIILFVYTKWAAVKTMYLCRWEVPLPPRKALQTSGWDISATLQALRPVRRTPYRYDLQFIKNFDNTFWLDIDDSLDYATECDVL